MHLLLVRFVFVTLTFPSIVIMISIRIEYFAFKVVLQNVNSIVKLILQILSFKSRVITKDHTSLSIHPINYLTELFFHSI